MSGLDPVGQDEVDEGTVVRRRRRMPRPGDGAEDAGIETPVGAPSAAGLDAGENTVVIGHDVPPPADPAVDLESTVVVQRGTPAVADDDFENTVLVERTSSSPAEAEELDHTVVVERADARVSEVVEEQTIVGGRRARRIGAESALVLGQEEVQAPSALPAEQAEAGRPFDAPLRSSAPMRPRSHRAKRTRIILPPSTEASTRAQAGVGPGAVAPYAPREVPPPPPPPMELAEGPDASRADAPQMPSVQRASARRSAIVLASVIGACAVSVTGLTLIAVTVFGG